MQSKQSRGALYALFLVIATAGLITTKALYTLRVARLATVSTAQPAPRIIKIELLDNAPVEVTAVKVDGSAITVDQPFQAAPGWSEKLIIEVRNTSDQPITNVTAQLIQKGGVKGNPGHSALYEFGTPKCSPDSTVRIEPGATGTLTFRGGTAERAGPADQRPFVLFLGLVIWNGDDSHIWSGGTYAHKVSEGHWEPDPPLPPATTGRAGSTAWPALSTLPPWSASSARPVKIRTTARLIATAPFRAHLVRPTIVTITPTTGPRAFHYAAQVSSVTSTISAYMIMFVGRLARPILAAPMESRRTSIRRPATGTIPPRSSLTCWATTSA